MRALVISLLLLLSFFVRAEGEIYRGSIKAQDNSLEWQEGEIKEVVIQIYPLQEVSVEDIRQKLESSDFCDFFYIGKIESIQFSKNNPVVLEVKADMTLKKYFNASKPLIWSYLALNIPINIEGMELKPQEDKIQEYITFDIQRHVDQPNIWSWILGILFLAIIILIVVIRKNKRVIRKTDVEEIKSLIKTANSRLGYEEIYAKKKRIEEIFGVGNPAFTNFFTIVDKHQYKKNWSEDDLYEINFILDEIKESLENG